MDSPASIATPEGRNLPRDLIDRALDFLDPNERSINGRLVSRDAGQRLSQPHHRTARLRFPLPQQAVDPAWQPHLHRSFQQLTFLGKVRSLSVAAASGSFVNVQLAWGLLQPCVSLGLERSPEVEDAGAAAVRHGHLQLLPWLVMHDCPMDMDAVLEAAAEHCDLAGMQRVWDLAGACCPSSRTFGHPHTSLAAAAGGSAVDGVAKLSWLLPTYKAVYEPVQRERPFVGVEMLAAAAEGAAASGSLPVLQWLLQQHGLDLRATLAASQEHHPGPRWREVLLGALHHGRVAVADWLVDEAGFPVLHQAQPGVLLRLWNEAAAGGSVEAMRWLLRRGVPVFPWIMGNAARSGRLEAVRFLHQECGLPVLEESVFCEAAASGSVPLATWLLQAGCPMSESAYGSAARAGQGAMLTWLAREARCPWDQDTLWEVMDEWIDVLRMRRVGEESDSSLEPAVWAMLEAGCPAGDGTDRKDSVGAAARVGLLALVRHLREELGLPFAPGTLAAAARGGCVPVVEWLVGAGCRAGDGDENDPYRAAGGQGIADVATLSCLRRLGVPWQPDVLRWAVDRGASLRVLRWMVEQGAPWDEATLRDEVVDRWSRGEHGDEDLAWFAERLGMCGPVAGGGAVGQ